MRPLSSCYWPTARSSTCRIFEAPLPPWPRLGWDRWTPIRAVITLLPMFSSARSLRGQTPLHGAAFWGWNDVVQFLVDHHANLNAVDLKGKTSIDSAMGRAGGNSRGGQRIDVHEDTAALLKKLGETASK
jgi:hypothetical protein